MSAAGKVIIVAEAAQGFEGDSSLARMLVRAAAAGRADMVKFQFVYADELATPDYAYYDLFKRLEMSMAAWEDVAREVHRVGIGLVFDVFGLESLRAAVKLGASAVKVHATDFFNETLFTAAVEQTPEVFFSTGGITANEIAALLQGLGKEAARKLTLLYGFQAEPTRIEDNNLFRLTGLRQRFPDLRLGFMDHADGEADEAGWLGVLALPLGVSVIEKHITLDRSLALEDYVSALGPRDFACYVDRIRTAEAALGSGALELSAPELAYRERAVKVVVTARKLPAGAIIKDTDVTLLRAPVDSQRRAFHRIGDVIGRKPVRGLDASRPICQEDLA